MIWVVVVLAVLVAWFVIGLALALVLGRAAHIADHHQRDVLFHRSVARLGETVATVEPELARH